MNQQPHCGPEGQNFSTIRAKATELHQLTLAILAQSNQPNLPELTQLVLKRSNLLGELTAVHPNQYSTAEQAELEALLQDSRSLDAEIEKNLRQVHAGLESHIKELNENKSLVTKYKVAGEESEGSRSRNA